MRQSIKEKNRFSIFHFLSINKKQKKSLNNTTKIYHLDKLY
jgi:hypothetical protein